MPRFCQRLLCAAALLLPVLSHADTVQVAVAANFTAPMQEIAKAFEQKSGHHLLLSFGSTGKFYTQIRSGAPFAVLLAADTKTPQRLASEGSALPASEFTYATGKLALWSATPGLVDAQGSVLGKGSYQHLAVANPTLAPYGAAAMQVLGKLNLLPAVQPKLVTGESIAQAYEFVATGNAELGFVALSQVALNGQISKGSAWVVPASLYDPLHQDAILLNAGKDQPAASALLDFLHSAAAKTIISAYGYDI
jgi:molybdate transport system substrate-binding protein